MRAESSGDASPATGVVWRRLALAAVLWLAGLGACSPQGPWKEGKADARWGENCVRTSTAGPETRVTNYVDPELCGRQVAQRGPYRVRTRPAPVTSVTQGR